MRRTLLPVAALASVGCLVGGTLVLWTALGPGRPPVGPNPEKAPWYFLGIADVLVYHAGNWPPLARSLFFLATAFALGTAFLRVERAEWRRSLSAGMAWVGVAALLASWAAFMPSPGRPVVWSWVGLAAGGGLSLFAIPLIGWAGWAQALRDLIFGAVFGLGVALALVPLLS
jgi:hypothetical protein